MLYSAVIRNGVAVLEPPVTLPEGTAVQVEVARQSSDFFACKSVDELAEDQRIISSEEPADASNVWPAEDSVDDLMALVREVRR